MDSYGWFAENLLTERERAIVRLCFRNAEKTKGTAGEMARIIKKLDTAIGYFCDEIDGDKLVSIITAVVIKPR